MSKTPSDFTGLLAGYQRFRSTGWSPQRDRWAELAEGQSPKVMVIACSDSRVDPAQIFDVSPGEIFVVRNVANLVPPYETTPGRHGVSAALEFAVTVLEVSDVIVMGHGACGGVKASLQRLFENAPRGEGGFIADWVKLLDDARDEVEAKGLPEAEAIRALEFACIKVSLANLRSFPMVREREQADKLKLHGGLFAIADGQLHLLDEGTGSFAPVTA
ncbi:carbonic anhydrase [Sphingomonas vulcanisoli]|uniref:Carbonic anhydrase n=1 Tax=Sphingomonas vulcanisoli TaxID=1658060 RepID=A0ABX0TME2_9SPHN|nr:carbonic anhydrase [Sphingomonas vulcanisoli]NIJ06606.1 carbonic anhydrase [Sphingomonas vulcanisoli]